MLTNNDTTCLSSRWACVLGLLVLPIIGCSDPSSDGAGGTGGTGGAGGQSGTGGSPETLQIFATVVENNPGGVDQPLEGVNICVEYGDSKNCFMTGANGEAVVDFPANQAFTWTMEKDNYGSSIGGAGENAFGSDWRPSGPLTFPMYPDAQLEAIAAGQLQLDPANPWVGGIVGLVPNAGVGLPGVTFEPVGSTIGQVGQEFYFDDENDEYSLVLGATTATLVLQPFGMGGFTEVAPGVQQFEIGGAVGECYGPSFGWSGDTANSIRVPVRDGFRTYGSMNCDGL